ncbi:inositol polyphosphate multikinase [Colossoma macropomum]|uniref:inositol polyphosphate multikinase n=1 Tax=Colossoma macropomum TaxID=42526 RepID=UPI001863BABE|nr:inositol polyphosphate multikinase [Colossoma macropomum]
MDSSSSVALRRRLEIRSSGPGPGPGPGLGLGHGSGPRLNGCVPLSHQVAGHKYGVDKVGILQHPDGTVLKQLQPPPRGPREMQFYSMVYAEDCHDPCLLTLQQHLPKFFGTWSSPDSPTDLYLKLEDVTRRFQKPCIMDVKIGQRSYDPFASQEKREQQIRKYPLMEEIGFLVLGMRVYNVGSDSFDSYDQHYGRGLVKETIKDGLSKFFFNGDVLRKDAITASIIKVQKILLWFEGQSQLNFYASSLLFVYDGVPSASPRMLSPEEKTTARTLEKIDGVLEYNNNIDQSLSTMYSLHKKGCTSSHHQAKQDNSKWQPNGNRSPIQLEAKGQDKPGEADLSAADVEVRMIDFAHVFPSEVQDHGYIYGLRNLLKVLQEILEN